jgi:hypothetical protein
MRIQIQLTAAAAALMLGVVLPARAQVVDPHAGHDHGPLGAEAKAKAGVPNLPPAAGGKLVVESPSFEAGKVERGGKVTHSFVVKNTGTGPLHLNAKPG